MKYYTYEEHKIFCVESGIYNSTIWHEVVKLGWMPEGIYHEPAVAFNPKIKERRKIKSKTPEYKASRRAYLQKPKVKARRRRPENIAYHKEYNKKYEQTEKVRKYRREYEKRSDVVTHRTAYLKERYRRHTK